MKFDATDYVAGAILIVGSVIWYVAKDFKSHQKQEEYDTAEMGVAVVDEPSTMLTVDNTENVERTHSMTLTFDVTGNVCKHDYVDLGLPSGLKWATCNVGAVFPYDYGDKFAWGEVYSNNSDDWSSYKRYDGNFDYVKVDKFNQLKSAYDAVSVSWGKWWRMPTENDWHELRNGCDWLFVDDINDTGKSAFVGLSKKNGLSIVFPAVSKAEGLSYWSRNLDKSNPSSAYGYVFKSEFIIPERNSRWVGLQVRGVLKL